MVGKKSIYDQVVEKGLTVDNHESDLYVEDCEEARRIVDGYAFKVNVRRFRGADGRFWLEVPFAFEPFWERRAK